MTGLDKILSEIQRAAQKEADKIIQEATTEAEKIQRKSQSRVDERCSRIVGEAQHTADDSKERTASSVDLQHRQNLLAIKQDLLAETLNAAQKAVANLPDAEYLKLMKTLAANTQAAGKAELLLNEKDKARIDTDFLASFPEDLEVTLAEENANIVGGFLLSTETIVINSTIEAIFERYRDRFIDTIQPILFD